MVCINELTLGYNIVFDSPYQLHVESIPLVFLFLSESWESMTMSFSKITTAVLVAGATVVFNTGVATAGEAVANGSAIQMYNGENRIGSCSATVINPNTVLTAGHCGFVGASVRFEGETIGTVDASGLRQGYDILRIKLKPGVKTSPLPADLGYQPKMGDAVAKDGWRSFHTTGTVSDPTIKADDAARESVNSPLDGQEFPVSTWTAKLQSLSGDSGGAVTHNGKVVGLVKGGKTSDVTTVTPLGPALKSLR